MSMLFQLDDGFYQTRNQLALSYMYMKNTEIPPILAVTIGMAFYVLGHICLIEAENTIYVFLSKSSFMIIGLEYQLSMTTWYPQSNRPSIMSSTMRWDTP